MFHSTDIITACRNADSVTPQNLTTSPVVATKSVLSLKEAAKEIKLLARTVDDRILDIAIKAAHLKKRIVEGEAGANVKWMSWMRRRVRISKPHLYALIHIGEAEDPKTEMEEWRRINREKSKKSRAKKKELAQTQTELSQNHKLMLALIPKLSNREATDEYMKLFDRYRSRLQ
jgi:hypothetical protein